MPGTTLSIKQDANAFKNSDREREEDQLMSSFVILQMTKITKTPINSVKIARKPSSAYLQPMKMEGLKSLLT